MTALQPSSQYNPQSNNYLSSPILFEKVSTLQKTVRAAKFLGEIEKLNFKAEFNLSSLSGANGFALNGQALNENSGLSVTCAGDINGDGISDLLIGAPRASPEGRDQAGQCYIVFGNKNAWKSPLSLSDLNGVNGFAINGAAAGDNSGWSVASAGDINGDGVSDFAIGANRASPGGIYEAGSTYLIFGSKQKWNSIIELSNLNGKNGFVLNGENTLDWSGLSVASAGDINDDGISDLIIGAPAASANGMAQAGKSYVIFGNKNVWNSTINLSNLNGMNGFIIFGESSDNFLGESVAGDGDINNDGIDDLIIGAPDIATSYVIFGSRTRWWSSPFELSNLNGKNGFVLHGTNYEDEENDGTGSSVAFAGDVNVDGIDDILIGAPNSFVGSNSSVGKSYIVYGSSYPWNCSIELSGLNGTNGFILNGEFSGDSCGSSVAGTGDINGDGIDDIIIGAASASPYGESRAGKSYAVFGSHHHRISPMELSQLDGNNGFALYGYQAFDWSATSVAGRVDINADGINDLIIGAPGTAPYNVKDAGTTYVVFGRKSKTS